ncbi:PH domain-containing protein [Nocardioides sp. AE5]|uniref:PH domain-containing protein n=1 Tax=Nocardioides sp. AE5 TaxID=2962573 RepID=UPI002882B6FC|nr:PH domain-containing protein [Nocardioides sp. AE5]MDT0201517.1 PH domain-containing protein [Nocardioides sp. AE5]
MPAASDPSLPRTWRPLGTRIAGIGGGVLLMVFCGALWFLLSADIRDQFTLLQRITLVLMGVGIWVAIWALARARATATEAGLTVVNGYRTREFAWAQVIAIHLPPGAPWATLDLADGETCAVMALQASDGDRAKAGVRELRRLIDRTP